MVMDRSFYQKMIDGAQGLEEKISDPALSASEKVAIAESIVPALTGSALMSIAHDIHRIANYLDARPE